MSVEQDRADWDKQNVLDVIKDKFDRQNSIGMRKN